MRTKRKWSPQARSVALLGFCLLICCITGVCGAVGRRKEDRRREDGEAVSIRVEGGRAVFSGDGITITEGGHYIITGIMEEGQICVDAGKEAAVTLELAGVDIFRESGPALLIKKAGNVELLLAEGTQNELRCGGERGTDGEMREEINEIRREGMSGGDPEETTGGALEAKCDLRIAGTGALHIWGGIHNGIHVTGRLSVEGGRVEVDAQNNGIRGKRSVTVHAGEISVRAGKDGIKSGGADDGYVAIEDGTVRIESGEDGIQAESALEITGGRVDIRAEGKGLRAEENLRILGGEIHIEKSAEGLECRRILIGGGALEVVSSDDGINACGLKGEAQKTETSVEKTELPELKITGGSIRVSAEGDGLDSNGDILVEGGDIRIEGPVSGHDGALDFGSENGGTCRITGGTLIALGSAEQAVGFDEAYGQCSFLHCFEEPLEPGVEITILHENGDLLYRYTPAKEVSSVVFSAPGLLAGRTYRLRAGEWETGIRTAERPDG